jgi:hypothetical protein
MADCTDSIVDIEADVESMTIRMKEETFTWPGVSCTYQRRGCTDNHDHSSSTDNEHFKGIRTTKAGDFAHSCVVFSKLNR